MVEFGSKTLWKDELIKLYNIYGDMSFKKLHWQTTMAHNFQFCFVDIVIALLLPSNTPTSYT